MSAPAEQVDPTTAADPETGELPWDGFKDGRIQNFLGLDWAGRKLLEYEAGLAQNAACHEEFVRSVEAKLAEERARLMGRSVERLAELQGPLAAKATFFRTAMEIYAREMGRKGVCIGSAKSRLLPSGVTVAYRTPREQIEVTDAEAIWSWANEGGFEDEIFPEPKAQTPTQLLSKSGLNKVLSSLPKSEVPGMKRTPGVEEVQVWTDLSKEEGR